MFAVQEVNMFSRENKKENRVSGMCEGRKDKGKGGRERFHS